MFTLLSIETSTTVCSVALHKEGRLVAFQALYIEQSHAEMLTSLIDAILFQTRTSKSQLSAIAVAEGPGSYTGLRIGTATAKGLCFALNIPLLAVNTLKAMAAQVAENIIFDSILLCPMIDARRMEVYTALYDIEGNELIPTKALVVQKDSFDNLFPDKKIVFFGNGSAKCKDVLINPRFSFLPSIVPSAVFVGKLAQNAEPVNLAYFEPFYLKEHYSTQKTS